MKTVMKKMFSLLLVAVLMVGVMPFQASAAELPVTAHLNIGDSVETVSADREEGTWSATVNDIIVQWFHEDPSRFSNATLEQNGSMNYDATLDTVIVAGDIIHIRLYETAAPHEHAYTETSNTATCTEAGVKTFTCSCGDSYTENAAALNHHVENYKCTRAGCNYVEVCSTCGDPMSADHKCPPCTEVSGCVRPKNHSGDHQCECGKYPQTGSVHATYCDFYEANNKTYSLKVWAKLWVGNSLNKTILLDEFTDLDGTEVVPYIIGNNVSRLESKFPSGYNNIEWTKAVYYYIDSNTTGTVDTNMNVNEEDNVYINLYSQEKLFVVNVHLGKYYGIDSTVKVGGFRVGETVSYDDVLKAVKKQYNVSSLKMYTYDNWCKVVEGKTSSTSPYFQVHDGDNVYEVYVSGSRKTTSASSSSSATADSSNPKTGDMIFAPVAVMGLSVSALAVLFFLNKKRAY